MQRNNKKEVSKLCSLTSDCRKRHETTSGERIEEVVSQNLHSQKSNNLQKQNPLKHRVSRDFPLVLPECHLSEYSYTPSGSILPISRLFGQPVSVSKVFRHAEVIKLCSLTSFLLFAVENFTVFEDCITTGICIFNIVDSRDIIAVSTHLYLMGS